MAVRFIADTHLGHKNIYKYRTIFESTLHNDLYFMSLIKSTHRKQDTTYFLGDIVFDHKYLPFFKSLPGKKILVLGNHDTEYIHIKDLVEVFDEVHSSMKYKEFILSHVPSHPDELRGKFNIHGHVHHCTIQDNRYLNVSVDSEFMKYNMRTLEELRAYFYNDNRSTQPMSVEDLKQHIDSNSKLSKLYQDALEQSRKE